MNSADRITVLLSPRIFLTTVLFLTGLSACSQHPACDMTPDGSVWLTVARLSYAEEKFHKEHGRYGTLVEMTNLEPGLPADVTAGWMGSYRITITLSKTR